MLALFIAMAVVGVVLWAAVLFARDSRPYQSDLYEAVREWLVPYRGTIFVMGLLFFVPLAVLLIWRYY